MKIRALTPADAEAFRTLRFKGLVDEPTAFGSIPSEEMPIEAGRAALENADNLVITGAFDADILVGAVGLIRERGQKYAHRAVIWGMIVIASKRGQGLGKQLVAAAIAAAKQMPGIDVVTLRVNAENLAAIALYEGAGFIEYGRDIGAMRVDGNDYDELMMRLTVSPL